MSVNHLGSEPVALETGRVFDQPRAEAAVRELLIAIGENPDRPGLRDTPARVARSYREVFAGLYTDPDTVLNTTFDEGHQELVLVRDIPLYSTCEHHLVSFHGVAHVGYIPGKTGKVTGLSKLARVVDLYAKRPQVQERLTSQIADAVMRKLDPRGAIVVIEAEHLCMAMRGDPQAWCEYHHLRGAWSAPVQRGLTFRGSGPYSAEVTVIELPAPGRTVVMGVLNVTTDSFSDGGRFLDRDAALARGLELKRLGVDIVDVGGESTRPGAARVDPDVEAGRVAPVIADLVGRGHLRQRGHDAGVGRGGRDRGGCVDHQRRRRWPCGCGDGLGRRGRRSAVDSDALAFGCRLRAPRHRRPLRGRGP